MKRMDLLGFCLVLAGCRPSSTPEVDAGDASAWIAIAPDGAIVIADPAACCDHLRDIRCSTGSDPYCARSLKNAPSMGATTAFAIACATAAKNVAAAQHCDPTYFCK